MDIYPNKYCPYCLLRQYIVAHSRRSLFGVFARDEESDGEWEAPMIDNPEYKVSLFFFILTYIICVCICICIYIC